MSCPNFSYQNRCVLVSNEDFEFGNCPELGSWNDGDRNYPSTELKVSEETGLSLVKIVLTGGNYSDACIDYIDVSSLEEKMGRPYYYTGHNRQELIDEIQYYFPIASTRLINKCLKGCNKNREDYEDKLAIAFETLEEEIRDREYAIADKIVNEIKADYGFRELVCTAVFSNGEAIYKDLEAIAERAGNINSARS